MRWSMLLLLLLPWTARSDGPDDVAKQELRQFQGAWQAVSIRHVDGRSATQDELESTSLTVQSNKFTLKGKDYVITGTFTIAPTKTPKAIDVLLDSTKAPEPLLGIYEIDGDIRRSCFVPSGQERPRQFPTAAEGYLRFEWKRLTR